MPGTDIERLVVGNAMHEQGATKPTRRQEDKGDSRWAEICAVLSPLACAGPCLGSTTRRDGLSGLGRPRLQPIEAWLKAERRGTSDKDPLARVRAPRS
jgi:hypothetical protein